MKERPILFSTPMVQAILEGRKTMTRRIIKDLDLMFYPDEWNLKSLIERLASAFAFFKCSDNLSSIEIKCPYGKIGDRLWVKESFCLTQPFDPETYYFGYKCGVKSYSTNPASAKYDYSEPDKWKPSIHMPREASRILLEITNIRVERLQDISEEDAKNEGIRNQNTEPLFPRDYTLCPACGGELVHPYLGENLGVGETDCYTCDTYKKRFKILWDQINGPESWKSNPWVWVISFKRVKTIKSKHNEHKS